MGSSRYLFITVMLSFLCRAGVETFCDGRQNNTQCYGALGGTVVIKLTNSQETDGWSWKQWSNSKGPIFQWAEAISLVTNYLNRSEFFTNNGTIRISSLSRTDGDQYKLETFNKNGVRTEVTTLQLIIQGTFV